MQKQGHNLKIIDSNLMKFSGINQKTLIILTFIFQPRFVSQNRELASLQPPNDLGGHNSFNEMFSFFHFMKVCIEKFREFKGQQPWLDIILRIEAAHFRHLNAVLEENF